MLQRQTFTHAVIAALRRFPRQGLVYLAGWALACAAADLLSWSHRPVYQVLDYVFSAALVVGLAAISFYSAARMIETPMTWRGALLFFGTGAALLVPIASAFGFVLLAAELRLQWVMLAAVLLLLISFIPITLLPGWPIWQLKEARLIGPLEAFRATNGFRWALIGASSVTSAINKAIPGMSSTNDLLTACALALGNGLIASMATVAGLAIAVGAYRRMNSGDLQPQQ